MIQSGKRYCTVLSMDLLYPKSVGLIKMCLNEAYFKIQIGINLSDVYAVHNGQKQGDALLPLLFNFVLGYVIRNVQEN
jgi:hypothetical protein